MVASEPLCSGDRKLVQTARSWTGPEPEPASNRLPRRGRGRGGNLLPLLSEWLLERAGCIPASAHFLPLPSARLATCCPAGGPVGLARQASRRQSNRWLRPARLGSACREEAEPGPLSRPAHASPPSDGGHLLPSVALKLVARLVGELITFSMAPAAIASNKWH